MNRRIALTPLGLVLLLTSLRLNHVQDSPGQRPGQQPILTRTRTDHIQVLDRLGVGNDDLGELANLGPVHCA